MDNSSFMIIVYFSGHNNKVDFFLILDTYMYPCTVLITVHCNPLSEGE